MRDGNKVPEAATAAAKTTPQGLSREEQFEVTLRRIIREELQAIAPGASQDLLTYAEAAAEFRCGVSTLRKWAREGKVRRYGEGRCVRVSRREMLALLAVPRTAEATTADLEAYADAVLRRFR
jgi:excisionase family DNA binding protein